MSSTLDSYPPFRLAGEITPRRYLWAALRLRPWLLVCNTAFGLLNLLPGVLFPVFIGHGVEAIGAQDWAWVGNWALAILALGLAQAGGATMQHFTMHEMWNICISRMRENLAGHVAKLGVTKTSITSGEMSTTAFTDLHQLGNFSFLIAQLIVAVLSFTVADIILMRSSFLLGMATLMGIPLMVVAIQPCLSRLQERQRTRRRHLGKVGTAATDIVSGLRILRGIGGERRFLNRFIALNGEVREAGVKLGRSEAWLAVSETVVPGVITIFITWLGARLVVEGAINVGELIAFYGISAFLVIPVSTIVQKVPLLSAAKIGAENVCALLKTRTHIEDPAAPTPLPEGALALYDTESGFTAPAGILSVVDAGDKAEALADRLTRFAEPAPGEQVFVGGIEADRVKLAELRRRVVYVHNRATWFSGILREEICSPHHSTVDLKTALYAADAEDIIDAFPAGIHELIGERGREVSGGQRQRLQLARALALDADVLVLDEPTSAVDVHTEARIVERIVKIRRGKTTVVFSRSPLWIKVANESFHVGALK